MGFYFSIFDFTIDSMNTYVSKIEQDFFIKVTALMVMFNHFMILFTDFTGDLILLIYY